MNRAGGAGRAALLGGLLRSLGQKLRAPGQVEGRFVELDAIRGVAALLVVLYHYTVRYGQIYQFNVPPLISVEIGKFGVQLFFMVSGFVIFLTLNQTTRARDFIWSRFARLYPAYWLAVMLTFSAVALLGLPGRSVSLPTALVNLTMWQAWFRQANVDGVYWTLALELSFYALMLGLYLARGLRYIDIVAGLWLAAIALVKYLAGHELLVVHWLARLMFILDYGHLFVAGIMFYRIKANPGNGLAYLNLLASLLVEYYLHPYWVANIVWFYLLFAAFIAGWLRVLAIPPLLFLGAISYSLYLIHQNLGYLVIRQLENIGLLNSAAMLVLPLCVALGVASLMYVFVERPALRAAKGLLRRSRPAG